MNFTYERRQILGGMFALTLAACQKNQTGAPNSRAGQPNVIFIMADDLGYADLSCTGSRHIRTPNIDSIAQNGLFFTQGYANSAICSPTRTALLSGNYQYRYRVGLEEPLISSIAIKNKLGMLKGEPTLPSVFKEQGYNTALVGKWHLGFPPEFNPLDYGYDYYFGINSGAADYFRHKAIRGGEERGQGLFENRAEVERQGYLTDLLGAKAIELIKEKDDRPLFLSLHFTAPHWPWESREDEDVARNIKDYFHRDAGTLETYAKMVQAMDENVGALIKALEEKGELENTIIVFTSDNGGERFSDNWPFTGVKAELLEGGIRVPLLIQWPEKIKAGWSTDQVITSMDFLPTLAAMAGNTDRAEGFDGVDLSSQIMGAADEKSRTLFWRFKANEQMAVRDGNWKYLKLGNKEHLFDVAKDPRERAELKDLHPEVFKRLQAKYQLWNETMLPYPDGSRTEDVKGPYADRY